MQLPKRIATLPAAALRGAGKTLTSAASSLARVPLWALAAVLAVLAAALAWGGRWREGYGTPHEGTVFNSCRLGMALVDIKRKYPDIKAAAGDAAMNDKFKAACRDGQGEWRKAKDNPDLAPDANKCKSSFDTSGKRLPGGICKIGVLNRQMPCQGTTKKMCCDYWKNCMYQSDVGSSIKNLKQVKVVIYQNTNFGGDTLDVSNLPRDVVTTMSSLGSWNDKISSMIIKGTRVTLYANTGGDGSGNWLTLGPGRYGDLGKFDFDRVNNTMQQPHEVCLSRNEGCWNDTVSAIKLHK